jgi:hypothetical protein
MRLPSNVAVKGKSNQVQGTAIFTCFITLRVTYKITYFILSWAGRQGSIAGRGINLTKHNSMKTYWGSGGIAPRILDLTLDGDEWSTSRPGRFTPEKEPLVPTG